VRLLYIIECLRIINPRGYCAVDTSCFVCDSACARPRVLSI